jgi:hypothetical protein
MSNAGITLPMLGGITAEMAKAASIPVPGALVIAPFMSSWQNYGSVGGDFTLAGAPVPGPAGAVFDGVDDAAHIDFGYTSESTTIARIRRLAATNRIIQIFGRTTDGSSLGGWAYGISSGKFSLDAPAAGGANTTLAYDTSVHIVTFLRSGVVTTLYIDGVSRATLSVGVVGFRGLILGAQMYYAAPYGFSNGIIGPVTHFASALTGTDRALVESWAA